MRILFKLHYAKFDVSNLFCSKVIEEKPLGGGGSAQPLSMTENGIEILLLDRFNFRLCLVILSKNDSFFLGNILH